MRTRSIVISIVILMFGFLTLVSVGVALLDHLGRTPVPSPERCAAPWNAPANHRGRAIASAAHFDEAVVSGLLAKERFPGCGMLFRGNEGEPWLMLGGSLQVGRVGMWDPYRAIDGGTTVPRGRPDEPNAVVMDDGRVRLDEP